MPSSTSDRRNLGGFVGAVVRHGSHGSGARIGGVEGLAQQLSSSTRIAISKATATEKDGPITSLKLGLDGNMTGLRVAPLALLARECELKLANLDPIGCDQSAKLCDQVIVAREPVASVPGETRDQGPSDNAQDLSDQTESPAWPQRTHCLGQETTRRYVPWDRGTVSA